MKRVFFVFLIFAFLKTGVLGQTTDLPKTKWMLGYFGETITHTGINLGLEYYPFQSERYQMILAPNLGGYVHIRNNTSLFLRVQWGQRVNFDSGLFLEQFMGLGYLHQFTHGGQNYEVLPNGAVLEVSNSGRPMFMPCVALGTGYDFSKKTRFNLTYFIRPEFFWKGPFNGYYLTHIALNTGVLFHFNNQK